MKIKSAKSHSLSIRKGCRVAGERIPVLAEDQFRSLGREYTAELKDMRMAVKDQLKKGLKRIDQSYLSSKYKICFLVHTLPMWPLKISEITKSTVTKLDTTGNNSIRKWLGLPRCLSETALFEKNAMQLPLKNISLDNRLEKTMLALELS